MQIIYTIPQSHAVVLTRFGKYVKTQTQGLHSRVPFFEKIYSVSDWGDTANKKGRFIELTEQNNNTMPKQCHSKDNVAVTIDASIYWRIIDVKKALFEVDVLPTAVIDTCLNALRSQVGKMTLDQILSSRQELSEKVATDLIETTGKWGIQISRVEIQELETSDETAEAMMLEMAAERRKRSEILQAEGIAAAKIKTAEAEAYAIKIKAEAEAEYLEKLSQSIGRDQVGTILMVEKILEGYKAISSNPAHKVFLPSNIKTLISDQIFSAGNTFPIEE
ncbi:MAG: SPFH/Band 7/PHB domain protein [Sphaerochaetaceae bacterium]|nr:SPFH/Band 7/PHB domain protein [Sphaerochaetaceae bacterium]